MPALAVWAGVECTVNRVGDRYFDQMERNGHATRIEDLDRFAGLGIEAIRYPVLWERTAPNGVDHADWSWSDQRLFRLRQLGIRPIVGLVHHGSGPSHTSLVDPTFPAQLAKFARAVAARYPWIDAYTPVNEPLTTARFSGLYGVWYPHGRDHATFVRALFIECKATILAMQAIRQINPDAQLLQTEDFCRVYSTPKLAEEAAFQNQRRWLGFDLLLGWVNEDHPLWNYLLQNGATVAELEWFAANACPPDVIGVNHYLTSDRLLDENIEPYPPQFHVHVEKQAQDDFSENTSKNFRVNIPVDAYVDVEAVRACADAPSRMQDLLNEIWQRYHLPIAITEAHLGCTREEQLRWLKEIWDAVQEVRTTGVEVQAVTAWSLLGAYDWNSLVTQMNNFYEPGVFDLRSPYPRPTAIAKMLQQLAKQLTYDHPVLDVPGWWRRSDRFFYPQIECCIGHKTLNKFLIADSAIPAEARPLLIVGATGTLGQAFARLCEVRGLAHVLLSRQQMDITDRASIDAALQMFHPWAVINATGYVRVDDAEKEPLLCHRINTTGAATLAEACADRGIAMVKFSSDLVFDGNCVDPYLESDTVAPLNIYGQSKAIAEQKVLAAHPDSLVIRTSAFFSPWDAYNFLTIALRCLSAGQPFLAASDIVVSPTYVPDLVNATLDLVVDGESGIWHLANVGAIAWADLAREVATLAGFNGGQIQSLPAKEMDWIAPRPAYSVLASERGILLPSLGDAIGRYLNEKVV